MTAPTFNPVEPTRRSEELITIIDSVTKKIHQYSRKKILAELTHHVEIGQSLLVDELLEKVPSISPDEAHDVKGNPLICIAASKGDVQTVKTLLAHGASPVVSDSKGKTALDYAKSKPSYIALVRILEEAQDNCSRNRPC